MNEFVFCDRSLEDQGLKDGDMVECTYSEVDYFTVGNTYPVKRSYMFSCLFVIDDDNEENECHWLVKFKPVNTTSYQKQPDFQNALDYLDTFGIPAEITDKGMHIEGELTKVQWLDFAKILLEGEE